MPYVKPGVQFTKNLRRKLRISPKIFSKSGPRPVNMDDHSQLCIQWPMLSQPPYLSRMTNEYRSNSGVALWLGSKDSNHLWMKRVDGRWNCDTSWSASQTNITSIGFTLAYLFYTSLWTQNEPRNTGSRIDMQTHKVRSTAAYEYAEYRTSSLATVWPWRFS